ncbi:MAG: nucleoside triphosphate pyrophosphohydrolase family protein [Saprospiraceae bacterium]|nr:nucleoside triphosphate pyrophosphohydrolase family protein [Candidatus Vicinibacter affinis]MBP6174076.1 nucleoside triphosphate pyrophosphohydrolase family protein [Saprospiraceae bacterium]MBK6572506.1 nucleoside triphosphate pyrophosphohydrolase family protein [Candidatus Vicinibacter affinis]MBK7798915.1 nucleoside triphosphate pyrophosphohydrolase family protein [Candidatus Vicinibacter affinis]MBK8404572.1 nucleoside triphosphate pyrophosphohydrolase family protein [Candidatus Vicinib
MNKRNFKEPQALNDVADFHDLFDMPVLDEPAIPSMDRCKLRLALLEEELRELREGVETNDLREIADALCDLQYVLSGAVLEFGLGNKFKSLFDEVQRSNMSKACNTYEEALATQAKYFSEKGTVSEIKNKGNQFLVYRKEDGKVLKSIAYNPADLKL